MKFKLLLIASLLLVATIAKAEEEFPSEISSISESLKEVAPEEEEDENAIVDRDEAEEMMQEVRFIMSM